jgi:hypothetical protein
MQSARKAAASSTPFHRQSTRPTPVVLDAGRAVPPTAAALELHYRIEVWVNEGGAGGEVNQ